MLAGIIGDTIGSVYEAHQWQKKDLALFQPLPIEGNNNVVPLFKNLKWVRKEYCWTDDTLCTLALYAAYITKGDPAKMLQEYCLKYRSDAIGFGKNFNNWIDNPVPYQSFANGSVMRIGFIPYLDISLAEKLDLGYQYTAISHDHKDSFDAVSGFILLSEALKNEKLKGHFDKLCLKQYLENHNFDKTVESMHVENTFEMNAMQTLLQAVVIVYESSNMEEVYKNCFYVGGDSDTLACIAGNIASHIYNTPNSLCDIAKNTFKEYPNLEKLVNHFEAHYWNND